MWRKRATFPMVKNSILPKNDHSFVLLDHSQQMHDQVGRDGESGMRHHRREIHRIQLIGSLANTRGERGQDHQHARRGTCPQPAQLVRG